MKTILTFADLSKLRCLASGYLTYADRPQLRCLATGLQLSPQEAERVLDRFCPASPDVIPGSEADLLAKLDACAFDGTKPPPTRAQGQFSTRVGQLNNHRYRN
jgi:hypothetical protein